MFEVAKKMEQPEMPRETSPKEQAQAVRQQLAALAEDLGSATPQAPELRSRIERLAEAVKKIRFGSVPAFDQSERDDTRELDRRWKAFQVSVEELTASLLGCVKSSTDGAYEVKVPVLENPPVRLAHAEGVRGLVAEIDAILASAAKRGRTRAERLARTGNALDTLAADEVGRAFLVLWKVATKEARSEGSLPAGQKEAAQRLLAALNQSLSLRAPDLCMDLLRAAMAARNGSL